jgi:SAM-dependent methyltransferase
MAYADLTIEDRNPIKRWLHRRRLEDALTVLQGIRTTNSLKILDFGAGDGELVRQIKRKVPCEAWVYEPTPALMAEARAKLSGVDRTTFAESLESVDDEQMDYVFCLEVFEHLPAVETRAAIATIHRLLKPGGAGLIGVPHEVFLPALAKGVFRMWRRYGDFDATPRNIIAAALGHPPKIRVTSALSREISYHFHHLGFDYRDLDIELRHMFVVRRRWFCPFAILGSVLNSEVYFQIEKA